MLSKFQKNKCMIMRYLYLVLIFFSCDRMPYKPGGTNYKHVSSPTTTIQLNALADDQEIYVLGIFDLNYSFDINEGEFALVKIVVDSSFIDTCYNESKYRFNTKKFKDGEHTLEIIVYAYTLSGSLGDRLKEEKVFDRKSFILIIENENQNPITFKSIEPKNGRLELLWKEIYRPNFIEYHLIQKSKKEGGWSEETVRKVFKKWQTKNWTDSLYVGGEMVYRVDVILKDRVIKGAEYLLHKSKPGITNINITEEKYALLNWTRCQFDSNFNFYKIYRNGKDIKTISDIDSTSFIDTEFGFGNKVSYEIYTGPGFPYPIESKNSLISYGNVCPKFHRIKYTPNTNFIYLIDYHMKTHLMDGSDLSILNSKDMYIDVSPDGLRAYGRKDCDGVILCATSYIYEVDPQSFAILDTLHIPDIAGYSSFISGGLYVVNQTQIFYASVEYKDPTLYTDGHNLIDVEQNILVAQKGQMKVRYPINHVSNNAEYVFLYDYYLYKQSNGFFNRIKSVNIYYKYFCFYDRLNSYITTNANRIKRYSLIFNNLMDEYIIENSLRNPVVDPITNYLGGITPDLFYEIYDLSDGSLVKKIKLAPDDNDTYFLINSVLFSGEGFYTDLGINVE